MNSNIIKIIACISMLIDHMGLLLFPDIEIFRIIGRTAMPLFAFFIGEGCLYTKNKLRYFLTVFSLAVLCQTVYEINESASGIHGELYLNILFTFSLSIIVCSVYLLLKSSAAQKSGIKTTLMTVLFLFVLFAVTLFDNFTESSKALTGINVDLDYGLAGVLLPLSAVIFRDRYQKLLSFTIALSLFSYYMYGISYYALFALFAALILCFYNGKRGSKKGKYIFYVFYPLHLVILHLINSLI